MSTVEAIHLHGPRGGPMRGVAEVEAVAGAGLVGDDRYTGLGIPGTHLTFVAVETVERLRTSTGIALAPGDTRRNVLTRGADLEALIGRRFRVGGAVCLGVKPCTPCNHLESITQPGVRAGLTSSGGGGLRADVVEGGAIRVGDPIEPLPD